MYEIVTMMAYLWLGPVGASPALDLKERPQFNSLQECLQELPWHVLDTQKRSLQSARAQGFELHRLRIRAVCIPAGGAGV